MIQSVMTSKALSQPFGISIDEIKQDESQATPKATSKSLAKNEHLLKWVEKMAALTQPDAIHWVDGSQEEDEALCAQMVAGGTFIKLNEELWPGCYYARSDASDVARVEDRTYICSLSKDSAGPTNNWEEPFEMRRKLKGFSTVPCADAPCMCCLSAWDRSVRPCRRLACSSPTRLTSWSTCASWRASVCRSLQGDR